MTPWASGTWWNPYAGLPVAIQVGFVIALLITLLSLTQLVVLRVKARTARRMLARIASSPDALRRGGLPVGLPRAGAQRGGDDRRQRGPAARGAGHATRS